VVTATKSFCTMPYATASFARYFFMNVARSSSGSRSRRSPVGDRYVNIFPLVDVYGMVAPLRSMLGSVAMSFSQRASFAAGIVLGFFLADIDRFRAQPIPRYPPAGVREGHVAAGSRVAHAPAASRSGRRPERGGSRPPAVRRAGAGRVDRGAVHPRPAEKIETRRCGARASRGPTHQDVGDARHAPPAHARGSRGLPLADRVRTIMGTAKLAAVFRRHPKAARRASRGRSRRT